MKPPEQFKPVGVIAFVVGAIATVAAALGAAPDARSFFHAYLVAFLYWNGISLGCLGWLLLLNLTGGTWGYTLHRLLAAGARTLPLMALLFLPLLLGMSSLFPWTQAQGASGESLFLSRELYLNVPFFLLRAAVYFVVWSALALLLTRWAYGTDKRPDPTLWQRIIRFSAAGLVLYLFTANFAAYDWLMSLQPEWYSALFGWLSIARDGLGALAFAVFTLSVIRRPPALRQLLTDQVDNDLGNVLLATLLIWAYLALMQYLVIWTADLPAEVIWYVQRTTGHWQWIVLALMALYLALPAALLLLRPIKRPLALLAVAGSLLLVMRLLHIYWLVMPVFDADLVVHWLDIVLPVALGGWWVGLFWHQLRRHHQLPVNHPKLQHLLSAEEQEHYETAS